MLARFSPSTSSRLTSAASSYVRRGVAPIFASHLHSTSVVRTGKVLAGNGDNFERLVENANEPVIVDFYADWCGPCRMLTPILQKAVTDNKKVTLVKINVDDNNHVAAKYDVSSLPTVAAFHKGKLVDKFIGLRDENFIQEFVEAAGSLGDTS